MVRLFLSSTALSLALLANGPGVMAQNTPVSAFGTSWNIENRQNAPGGWSYIPNYAYPGCDQYITYKTTSPYYRSEQPDYDQNGFDGTPLYNEDGSGGYTQVGTDACCGAATVNGKDVYVQAYPDVFVKRQACGPDFWPFSTAKDLRGEFGNGIKRCINAAANDDNKFAGQQTPIDIRTFNSPAVKDADGNVLSPGIPATPQVAITSSTGTVQSELTFHSQPAASSPSSLAPLVDTCKLQVTIGTKSFRLFNFHFHNSEHTINGIYHPIETHFVHVQLVNGQPDPKKPLVLGAFLSLGTYKNFFLERLIVNFNNPATRSQPITINPYEFLLPVKTSYWHYKGSLTTPPCQTADGAFVRWFLFKKPIVVSWQQGQFLSQYFNDLKKSYNAQNNRPVNAILSSTKIYTYGANPWP